MEQAPFDENYFQQNLTDESNFWTSQMLMICQKTLVFWSKHLDFFSSEEDMKQAHRYDKWIVFVLSHVIQPVHHRLFVHLFKWHLSQYPCLAILRIKHKSNTNAWGGFIFSQGQGKWYLMCSSCLMFPLLFSFKCVWTVRYLGIWYSEILQMLKPPLLPMLKLTVNFGIN